MREQRLDRCASDGSELEGLICSAEWAIEGPPSWSAATWRGRPELVVMLGDRYEMLVAALAATHAQIPIAHIHGGEATYGSFDDSIRHAITKLAHIHFVAAPEYRDRVLQLGEDPARVFVTGAPGLDNLVDLPPRQPGKYFVVTVHPETATGETHIGAILKALERFPEYRVIFTGVNNDPGAEEIWQAIRNWTAPVARELKPDLTPRAYILLCRHAAAVIGNSSSGIIECPTLGVPTVNVGRRQEGRLSAGSICDAVGDPDDIKKSIRWALRWQWGCWENPYGQRGASKRIADILTTIDLTDIRTKRFHTWPH